MYASPTFQPSKPGQGLFLVFSGAEIGPHSHWNLGDFSLVFVKKNPNLQKHFFFFEDWDFHSDSQHTHKLHGDILL